MPLALFRPIALLLAALLLTSGCALRSPFKPAVKTAALPKPGTPAKPEPPKKSEVPLVPDSYWHGDTANGPASIVVQLDEQRVYFYKGKHLVGMAKTSTGRSGFDTPPGNYRVTQKDKNHVSTLYGDFVDAGGSVTKSNVDVTKNRAPEGSHFRGAKMPYYLRFHSGYGLHAGRVPNYRASHGCVRLPSFMAKHYFENSVVGTPVRVVD